MGCSGVGQVPGSLIDWAAGVIGINCKIVRAQINMESGGNPAAVSSAGAEGVAQFIPSTWAGEGCAGSPFNVGDAMKCYAKYMYSLVKQFHGNIRDALAAYNAGPGNLAAGYGYADSILAAAGQPQSATASGGTGKAGTGGGSGAVLTSATSATCAFGPKLPVVGQVCLMKKTTIRHAAGVALMLSAVVPSGLGVILLGAFAFRASGAARAAAQTARFVPGPGGRALAAAGRV